MRFILVILMILILASCSSTERGAEEPLVSPSEDLGAGIFTGADGEFNVTKYFSDEEKRKRSGGYYILDLEGAPPMSEEEFKDFERFREWLRSKEEGSLEYQQYQEWRRSQQSAPSN